VNQIRVPTPSRPNRKDRSLIIFFLVSVLSTGARGASINIRAQNASESLRAARVSKRSVRLSAPPPKRSTAQALNTGDMRTAKPRSGTGNAEENTPHDSDDRAGFRQKSNAPGQSAACRNRQVEEPCASRITKPSARMPVSLHSARCPPARPRSAATGCTSPHGRCGKLSRS